MINRMNQLFTLVLLILAVLLLGCTGVHSVGDEEEKRITHLPGYSGELPFKMYTGYITVNETSQNNLFYYFVKSSGNASEDPLVFWVTGGPGCSGWSALVFETGPLKYIVEENNGGIPRLTYNPYTLTQLASVIFIDSPTGTGYSYSEDELDYILNDTKTAQMLQIFLNKWMKKHPEYLPNPLFMQGDSYSGITLPLFTWKLIQAMEAGDTPKYNLKGYTVGNPVTDPYYDLQQIPFAHGMGLISNELYEACQTSCEGRYDMNATETCGVNVGLFNEIVYDINQQQVLENNCFRVWSPKPRGIFAMLRSDKEENYVENEPLPHPPDVNCRAYGYYLAFLWSNNDTAREALYVRNGTIRQWLRCSKRLTFTEDVTSTVEFHKMINSKGYRALIYNGDTDMVVPFIGTQKWIKSLNYTIVDKWRPWFVDSQVAGYTRTYSNNITNLTYATLKGAGHTAPEFTPKFALEMFQRWYQQQSL